jgi:hypothetical protein
MAMCAKHWYMLPSKIRDSVWREYRPGQEIDKSPLSRYMAVMEFAISFVAGREGKECDSAAEAAKWRQRAIDRGLGDPLAGLVQ